MTTSEEALGMGPTELPCLDELTAHAYVARTLPDDRHTAVIAHLDGCAACRELVDDITVGRRLGEAPVPIDFGTYRLGALIAQGGMGRIYRAFDTTLQRDVALKVPRSASPAMMRRFEREAAITARLQHPGIVPIHAAGHSPEGTPFYVMRLVDGRTLDRIVDDGASRIDLVEHVVAIAETMAYVHDKRIVHRDLKPNNVLIGEFGETLIIDWGLGKRLTDTRESLPVIGFGTVLDTPATREALRTRAGDVLGTPAFMPPEQAAGEPVDERGDVYAIGALLRYVLAGRVTLPTEELDAPAPLLAVAKRALAPHPADRYANAGELVIALRAAAEVPKPAARPVRRWPAIAASIALVAGITGLLVWGLWPRSHGVGQQITLAKLPSDALRPALSPSGKRVAYGSQNRIEVRDLESGRQWTRPGWLAWPYTVEFPNDHLVLYTEHLTDRLRRFVKWNLITNTIDQTGEVERYWIGSLAQGQVWIENHLARRLVIETKTGDVAVPSQSTRPLRIYAISPDHRRLAFVEHTTEGDRVRLVEGDKTFTAPVEDVASMTFLDDDTILYGSGTLDGTTLLRMPIEGDAFGVAEPVFTSPKGGWLGTLSAAGDRIVGSWINSTFEARLHQRPTHVERALDKVAASAPLGWRDVVSYWTWNSATRQLELNSIAVEELPMVAPAMVPGDPVNATLAGELVIVTLRGGDGREVIAVAPNQTQPVWTAPRGVLSFVRCAGDRAPPCVAGKRGPSGTVAIHRIDPATGVLGERLVPEAEIADAAIDALGTSMTWVVDNTIVHLRGLEPGGVDQVIEPRRSGIHSLAFDPTGGILASSTATDGRTVVRFADGRAEPVANAGRTIVSLIRPSPDGTQLLYRARALGADLVEVRLQ